MVSAHTLCAEIPSENRALHGWVHTKRFMLLETIMKKIEPETSANRRTPTAATTAKGMVEDIVGCKWTLTVLQMVREGINRPGAIEHAVEGLSAKVLNERLRKLTRFELLERRAFAEIPPRVEYHLTPLGIKLGHVLDQIEALEAEMK